MNGTAPELLTIAEVGERLRISRRMTAKLLARGEFSRVRVGRAVRVPAADVDEFISRNYESRCATYAETLTRNEVAAEGRLQTSSRSLSAETSRGPNLQPASRR
jgi:excisionase family DNA binding protein